MNLALVSDGGEPDGTNGDQQDDPRFGDIRIGMVPLPSGVLAETFLPPPANGGTDAGDILFNSTVNWQINSNYDLMTVAAHEFGHALGLGESSVSTAVMYGTYNGIKQALTSDDIAGIDSIYGTRQFDQFNNSGTHNSSLFTAANINSYITSNAQIAIPSLDITTAGQAEWFYVNVPVHHHGDDERHGAVEQPELARPQSSGLQLQSEPGRTDLGAQHVRGDDQPVDERGVGSGLLRQGHGRGRGRTDRRLRLAAQLRQSDAVADPAPQHGRRPATGSGRRHGKRQRARRRQRRLDDWKHRPVGSSSCGSSSSSDQTGGGRSSGRPRHRRSIPPRPAVDHDTVECRCRGHAAGHVDGDRHRLRAIRRPRHRQRPRSSPPGQRRPSFRRSTRRSSNWSPTTISRRSASCRRAAQAARREPAAD